MRGVSYYAERSARDPAWREAQLREAVERERRRREADPDGFRERRRQVSRRHRAWQAQHGLLFSELLRSTGAEPDVLAFVLRDEVRRGHLDYRSTSRRYVLNGGLEPAVRRALLWLTDPATIMD
jgi:hypothetical protein